MAEESATVEVIECPPEVEFVPEDGNGIPWLYIYLGFLTLKAVAQEIGLVHQYVILRNKAKC